MISRHACCLLVALGVLLFADVADAQVSVSEGGLRRATTSRVTPVFPAASIARGSEGVAVVLVTAAANGRVERVEVLQSPDLDIADSVREAVMQWAVRTPQVVGAKEPNSARDKLTFYFRIRNGRGVVLDPDQVPGNEDVFAAWLKPVARPSGNSAPIVRMMDHGTIGVEEIDDDTLRRLLDDQSTILLDIRDREPFAANARPRAVNIPFDEVSVRAGAELPREAQIVIDCSQEETSKCRFAASTLGERGFKKVAIYIP